MRVNAVVRGTAEIRIIFYIILLYFLLFEVSN